jgi:hypothetical protein
MSAWATYTTTSGPRRRPRHAYWLLAVAAAGILGVLVGGGSNRPAGAPRDPAETGPSPRTAVIAALSYLDALRWDVVIDDDRRLETISSHAAEDSAAELDAELAAPAETLRAAVSKGPVVARRAVLGYRLESFSRDRASVSVWGVALFATGVYPASSQWSTSQIDLVWSSNQWRVVDLASEGGPSPESRLSTLAAAARDFRELNDAP